MGKSEKHTRIEERIQELTQQYENALKKGEEFSVLKEIRDQLRQLHQQLPGETPGQLDDGEADIDLKN